MRKELVASLALVALAMPAGAIPLGTSARQAESGSLKILAYYQGASDQPVDFQVNGGGTCATASGGASFACGGAGDVEAEGSGSAGMVKLAWQPAERLQYYAHFGVGSYDLRIPSTTVSNLLTGDKRGLIYGAGVRASIVPDTIVTPAIALDLSMTRSVYDFNRRFGAPGTGSIDQRLELLTYQVAVETSHLFVLDENWKLEPYGGLKWTRVQADLKDLVTGDHAGGKHDAASPFIGLRLPIGEREALFAEASFVAGTRYAAGLDFRFK